MQAYKTISSERIYCRFGGQTLKCATYTDPQSFVPNGTIEHLLNQEMLKEIDLKNEAKIFPHLYKPLREQLLKEL